MEPGRFGHLAYIDRQTLNRCGAGGELYKDATNNGAFLDNVLTIEPFADLKRSV